MTHTVDMLLNLCMLGNISCFFVVCGFFFFFSKKSFRNTIRVSNSLDPDQARQNMPDISSGLIWVQIVCKGYQQMAKVTTRGERAKTSILNKCFLVFP